MLRRTNARQGTQFKAWEETWSQEKNGVLDRKIGCFVQCEKIVKWGTHSHALQALRATATNQINVDKYVSPELFHKHFHHVAGPMEGMTMSKMEIVMFYEKQLFSSLHLNILWLSLLYTWETSRNECCRTTLPRSARWAWRCRSFCWRITHHNKASLRQKSWEQLA